jgi:phosphoglycolate phosphatase
LVTLRCGRYLFHNVEAVVFDKDGTLANSQAYLRAMGQKRTDLLDRQIPGLQTTLWKMLGLVEGDRVDPAGLLAVGSRRENEIAVAAAIAHTGRSWTEALAIAQAAFLEVDQHMPRKADLTTLFPGTLPFVQTLHGVGLKLAILSADTTPKVKDFTQNYGLTAYFQLQMGAQVGISKPDPRLLDQACVELDVLPTQILVIGDSSADMQLAKRGGAMAAIGVTWGWDLPVQLPDADVMIDHWDEITVLPNHP